MKDTTLIFNKLYKLSQRAYKKKHVPISALVVDQSGKIIAIAYNKTRKNSVTTHAEIYALNQACRKKRTNKISDCSIWVTVEPCMMCLGAIINSGIKVINYYLSNEKYGFLKSNHTFDVSKLKVQHIRKYEENMILKDLMKKFFEQLR
ncbi:tRNA adenosine deaminase [Spiroplasma sp. ChiS]|uniref:deaminase n=1 Tax=Spiroplasma sp. ChiS TaxID=2099885 RepID=UPI000CFA7434|nr:deaminase [Spiroplasma sp. ChiS]PQP78556.1 tRNA adenosine deaminase [Spiroplasma sp. ChiS]